MNKCMIILLGITGDLAKRKLIPAIYSLISDKKLENFTLIGVAIDDMSIEHVLKSAKEFIENIDEAIFAKMLKNSYYQKLDFNSKEDFIKLNAFVSALEKEQESVCNRLVYVASMPYYFCKITKNCIASGLMKKVASTENFWYRIVYEKPFGSDAVSALEINTCIAQNFYEDQVYRIDHYLTKEVVGNIALVRFTNCIFEPLWNNNYIDQVNILLEEKLCIEGRGAYYDKYGAVRDVVQNHMLELLALIAMESPDLLSGDSIRNKRVDVLKNVEFVDGLLGQYKGYKKEDHIKSDSETETFASLLFKVNNARWSGVPFYLKTGKCLGAKKTEIQIKFKKIDCILLKGCPVESNYLTIGIYPKGTFYLTLNAKKPGMLNEVMPVEMEFCQSCVFGGVSPESYEIIFQEVLNGEKSISVRFDEIECLWKITDAIYAHRLPMYTYDFGSSGPKEIKGFEYKFGIKVKK